MATGGIARERSATQQGIEDTSIDYYDIMVIGKTGMGKTTTADKLLVANPRGHDYLGAQYSEPEVKGGRMNVEDLSIWLLSNSPDELPRVKTRLKNIAFARGLDDPHKEINGFHSEDQPNSGMTPDFELISNESTKVRVLDVPGFFGEGDAGAAFTTSVQKAHNSADVALRRMRNILRIQTEMNMKFRRVLYFLPVHGALKRCDSYLETELSTLAKYFGKAIFDCMVVIVTMPSEAYDGGHEVTFSERAMTTTMKFFNVVLSRILSKERNLPQPAFLFISMADTCETILANVKSAHVACDYVNLEFDTLICARCGSKAQIVRSERVAVYTDETELSTIPYNESTCHPLFIPRYTDVLRFIGGIVYIVSFHTLFKGYLDEVCVECQQRPGSHGCTRVKTKYELKGDFMMVDHTNNTSEPIKYEEREQGHSDSESLSAVHVSSFMVFAQNPISTTSGVCVNRETKVDIPPIDPYSDMKG